RNYRERMWLLYVDGCFSWTVNTSKSFSGNFFTTKSFSGNFFTTKSFSAICTESRNGIKTLEARISVLEGQLEMERHPENHTLESAGILHEIYQGMRNLNME
ncbi:hypothetical protein Tco_1381929, partial [Tanacetum coccineum]